MSVKKAAESVIERRLKPIYDSIDSGNNKKAIQEADKVLRKHPGTHSAKALKALAVIRCDRHDEGWVLIEEVEKLDVIWDDNTLQALTHCFKELAVPRRIVLLYEKACQRLPRNEQLLTHLFMAYVRIRDYKLQQKTALLLYKDFTKNPYYFWTIMSITMQAIEDPKLGQSQLLPLAEKMVLKSVQSQSIQAEAEVQLYLLILERLEKYPEALDLLEGSLADRFLSTNMWERPYRVLELMIKAGRYQQVVDRCLNSLQDQPDDWRLFAALFDAAFALIFVQKEQQTDLVDRLTCFIISLSGRVGDRYRGPHLARLRFIVLLLENDLVVHAQLGTSIGEPVILLSSYCSLFGSRPCCTSDLQPYLWLLGERQRDEFLDIICRNAGFPCCASRDRTENYAINVEQAYHHLTCLQLAHCLNVHRTTNTESRMRLARECVSRAEKVHADQLSDLYVFDLYILMAVQLLWDSYSDSEHLDVHLLFPSITLLEWARTLIPDSSLIRFLLAKIYSHLGACSLVLELVHSLDIKYMQRDTLGYLFFDHLNNFGYFADADVYYVKLICLFDQGERELSECLTTAYRNGSFCQIDQIVTFTDRYRSSHLAVGADIQSRYSAIYSVENLDQLSERLLDRNPSADAILDAVDWTSVRDNGDFSVIPLFDSGDCQLLLESEISRTFSETIDWLRLKQMISSSLAALCRRRLATNTNKDEQEKFLIQFHSLIGQLKAHNRHCLVTYGQQSTSMSLQGPIPTNFSIFLNGPYTDLMDCVFESAYVLAKYDRDMTDECIEMDRLILTDNDYSPDRVLRLPTIDELHSLVNKLLMNVETPVSCTSNTPVNVRLRLLHASWTLQTVAVAIWTLTLVADSLPVLSGKKVRKRPPVIDCVHSNPATTKLYELARIVATLSSSMDSSLVELRQSLDTFLDPLCIGDSLLPDNCSNLDIKISVKSAIDNSYQEAIGQMRTLVRKLHSATGQWR